MKKFAALVFDETIYGTTATYTAAKLNEVLASADRLSLHAVADETGGTSPTLLVQIEHSGDARGWGNKSGGAAEIPATSVPASASTSLFGADSSTIPTLPFARLRVQLGGTSPVAHVKIYACGRDW